MVKTSLLRPRERTAPQATFHTTRRVDATVLTAAGELDGTVHDHLGELLRRELAQRPPVLVVDAAAVTFCCARAWGVLANAAADARAAGVPLVLATRQRAVLRPLSLLGLQQLLPVHGDVAEALASPRWAESPAGR